MNTMSNSRLYRTVILDDEFLQQSALEKILSGLSQIQIVGTAATTMEAFSICERLKPDLIIADAKIGQEKMAGATFVKNIKKILPDVRILGLTYHADLIDGLKRAGCDYVANKALIESPEDARKFIREAISPRPEYYRDFAPPSLTEAQDRVLKLICEGYTEDEIAKEFGSDSRKPIRNIKNTLFDIFGAKSAANLIHLAYRSGYLHPDRD
ncbi:MAG TPA: response regulator transcription factor [Anaerolineales bacterium]|nr:response regulator transcription factor [Anaerolineales bacterium]